MEARSTVPHATLVSFDKNVTQSNHFKSKSTSTVPDINEVWDGNSLKSRINTIWQMVLIILAVLMLLAFGYLGKCVHRHLTSSTQPVSHTNTMTPNETLNESHQLECRYEQIQEVEHNDSERYLTPVCDDTRIAGTCPDQETGVEKINPVSIAVPASNDKVPKREKTKDNNMYENIVKDYDYMNVSPCM